MDPVEFVSNWKSHSTYHGHRSLVRQPFDLLSSSLQPYRPLLDTRKHTVASMSYPEVYKTACLVPAMEFHRIFPIKKFV